MTPGGVNRCLHPVSGAGLGKYVGDVTGHGVYADEQLSGNLRVVLAQGHKPQHLSLALSELMRKYGKYAQWSECLAITGYSGLGPGQQGEEFFLISVS